MANPPFNVKTVKESTVKNDKRFHQYGLPKNKGKKEDKITDANYLWISLFATSLKENGRAGFVIANSASDARNSEYDIRKKIVDSGMVDMMVTMPSNMFYTVTLPATIWFFDKGKIKTDRKDKILFLDARSVFRQIDRAHREWTEEQFLNLATIIRLHRGEDERFTELISNYLSKADECISPSKSAGDKVVKILQSSIANLKKYVDDLTEKFTKAQIKKMDEYHWLQQWNALKALEINPQIDLEEREKGFEQVKQAATNADQHQSALKLSEVVNYHSEWIDLISKAKKSLEELLKWTDKNLKVKNTKNWSDLMLARAIKNIEEQIKAYSKEKDLLTYFFENIQWMQERFPEGKYTDVVGLCKVADRSDYVDEHDYSLNPGRYVGVEEKSFLLSLEDYLATIGELKNEFDSLNKNSHELEKSISDQLTELLND
jgi:type I restriction enzyme M protein